MPNQMATPFVWRTHDGRELTPQEMETKHLFNTLKMVWNHSCPVRAQIRPFKRWWFGPSYTKTYMANAVRFMYAELLTRQLDDYMTADLRWMEQWFRKSLRENAKCMKMNQELPSLVLGT